MQEWNSSGQGAVGDRSGQIRAAQDQSWLYQVAAPFDGVVSTIRSILALWSAACGPTKLASIIQTDPIYVNFKVSEPQFLQIKRQ